MDIQTQTAPKPKQERSEYLARRKKYYEESRDRLLQKQKQYAAANPEAYRARCRNWKEANPELSRACTKRWDEANPERRRSLRAKSHLKCKYGISTEEWDAMFSAQGFRCASCKSGDPRSKKGWATDHDHKSGRVRGILCPGCNLALGHIDDDATRLRALADYIEAHQL